MGTLLDRARAHLAAALDARWERNALDTGRNELTLVLDEDDDPYPAPPGSCCLWLSDIAVEQAGERLGFRALAALHAFCEAEQVSLYVGPIVSSVWDHPELSWLQEDGDLHGDPVRSYNPRPR